jgi:hypothetical protein
MQEKPNKKVSIGHARKKMGKNLFRPFRFHFRPPSANRPEFFRSIMESDVAISDKFLTVMIWGYGDIGYGPYRVNRMVQTLGFESKILTSYEMSRSGNSLGAYDYLSKNKIQQLGPSFGTKWIYFTSPLANPAPIYDSFIALWIENNAKNEFIGVSTNPENWNLKTYTRYCEWTKKQELEFNIFADTLEYIIFKNAIRSYS